MNNKRHRRALHNDQWKSTIKQEDVTFIHMYAPNIEALKYIKQILTDIKGETAIQ